MGEKFIEFSSFVIVLRLSYDVKVASLINQRKYEFFRTGYVNVTQLFTIDDFLRNWKMFRSFQFNDDISNFIRISFFFFSKFQSEQVCRPQTTMGWELRKNRKHDIREMEKQKSSVWREKCCDLDEFCNLELLHAFSPSLLTVVAAVERSELE